MALGDADLDTFLGCDFSVVARIGQYKANVLDDVDDVVVQDGGGFSAVARRHSVLVKRGALGEVVADQSITITTERCGTKTTETYKVRYSELEPPDRAFERIHLAGGDA